MNVAAWKWTEAIGKDAVLMDEFGPFYNSNDYDIQSFFLNENWSILINTHMKPKSTYFLLKCGDPTSNSRIICMDE